MVNFLKFLSAKKSTASEPRASSAAAGTGTAPATGNIPPPLPSQLLKDVLGQDLPPDRLRSDAAGKKSPIPPLSQRLNVGARLADAKRRATEGASSLRALVDEDTSRALGALVESLEKRVCRIAFVGQMNAGKSSLINVLVEQPELLPADINPWTTVITNLYFGVPGAPSAGASFVFFTAEEWRRLSIGGRTRELTERLFPDFDWEALNEQVAIMRRRAERKLGPSFETLLGTEHAYLEITHGLLNRYVGAGQPEGGGQGEGEFSDITKQANIFFDLGAFNFPAILIDTPGVNDPFLVRDEITRQSLQDVDICVIVVTARQPLSNADISLLRMLRGLNKNRLLIFVNKIDEIEGGDEVLRDVSQQVSAILKQEFPSAHIPIVFGSALWARKALFPNQARRPEGGNDIAPGAENIFEGFSAPDWPSHSEIADTVTAETFFLKSGLSSLAVSISELMRSGTVADAITTTNSTVDAVCRNWIAFQEAGMRILSKMIPDMAAAKNEASALNRLQKLLSAELEAFVERLAQIYTQKVTDLHRSLAETVQSFIPEIPALSESATLAQVSDADLKLRVKLEIAFLGAFESAEKAVRVEQERLLSELGQLLKGSGLVETITLITGRDSPSIVPPSLAALSEPAALGLAVSFGDISGKALPPGDQHTALERVIVADFQPIVVSLADEAARALNDMSADILQQMRVLTLRPLDAVIQRVSNAMQGVESVAGATGAAEQRVGLEIGAMREATSKLKLILAANRPAVPAQNVKI